MSEFLSQTEFWHWWVLGAALLLIELMIGTFYLLWAAFAAGVMGFVVVLAPTLDWRAQFLLFGALSISSIVIWNRWRAHRPDEPTDQPMLNRRGQSLVGREFTLTEAITQGVGNLPVDDSIWRVRGPDLPAGTRVRVQAIEGATLVVAGV